MGGKLIASNRFGGMRDFAIQFVVILVGMRAENRSGMREL